MEFRRSSGILMPLFSLPSKYGIGSMGKEAFKFVDKLAAAGQSWWQMLPVEMPGYGNSPYFCPDAFRSNVLFIDIEKMAEDGVIEKPAIDEIDWGSNPSAIDYEKVIEGRRKLFGKFTGEELEEIFMRQWRELKTYANEKGVGLIGDIPIYVPADSKDVAERPEEFLLDEEGNPSFIAGVPPDEFSEDGQLWGNALYNWQAMKDTGYNWWIRRIGRACELFDVVRIDHFRGFADYWAVPASAKSAKEGHWELGPGIEFVSMITSWFSGNHFIAEDLGTFTPVASQLLADSGLPGMKILEFAFDPSGASSYLPHNHIENCVCYSGTHDNDTLEGWISDAENKKQVEFAKEYLNTDAKGLAEEMLRAGMSSVARLFVSQLQDWLGLGSEARINTPGTVGGNWEWRVTAEQLETLDCEKLKKITRLYSR